MATSTPWGPSQETTRIARGITFYSTAGHGGFKLSAGRNAVIRREVKDRTWGLRGHDGWYEEDCDAALVVVAFPEHFSPEQVQRASQAVKAYYAFDTITG